jgi:fructose 1,6-bisphosphatase
MFIDNFQGIYEWPSTTKTLNTIKKKHDESLWNYVKHFCNAKNIILNI